MGESKRKGVSGEPKTQPASGNGKFDWGEWVYDHRIALSATVIVYLAVGVLFLSAKVVLQGERRPDSITIDLSELERLERELEEAERLNRELNRQAAESASEVENRYSNENARLNDNLRDDRHTPARELYEQAERVQRSVRQSRELYEQGLSEQSALQADGKAGDRAAETESSQARGSVTVSYSLSDPIRTAVYLNVPAYRCRGAGRVVVDITVDRGGEVTGAEVDKARSSSDYCMTTTAVEAALASRFNVDASAPQRQRGTVTYIFVPQ